MSQGIVRVTPRPGAMGTLQVTVADSNPYGVKAGALLQFLIPEFPVNVGNHVACNIDSATMATVTKVLVTKSVTADA